MLIFLQRLEVSILKELLELKAARGYYTVRSPAMREYSVPASPQVKSMRRLIRTNSVPNNSTLSKLVSKYRSPAEISSNNTLKEN